MFVWRTLVRSERIRVDLKTEKGDLVECVCVGMGVCVDVCVGMCFVLLYLWSTKSRSPLYLWGPSASWGPECWTPKIKWLFEGKDLISGFGFRLGSGFGISCDGGLC